MQKAWLLALRSQSGLNWGVQDSRQSTRMLRLKLTKAASVYSEMLVHATESGRTGAQPQAYLSRRIRALLSHRCKPHAILSLTTPWLPTCGWPCLQVRNNPSLGTILAHLYPCKVAWTLFIIFDIILKMYWRIPQEWGRGTVNLTACHKRLSSPSVANCELGYGLRRLDTLVCVRW